LQGVILVILVNGMQAEDDHAKRTLLWLQAQEGDAEASGISRNSGDKSVGRRKGQGEGAGLMSKAMREETEQVSFLSP
jgi:hypothetical protein